MEQNELEIFEIIVEEKDQGTRMDAFLAAVTAEALSRSYIQKLMERGMVSVNGKIQGLKKYQIKPLDRIVLRIPAAKELDVAAENIPLEIVYEDEDVAVINKPKGMVVHPAPGNSSGTMVNALLYHCKDLSSIGGVIRPGIVHRIDKDTSGLIMVAKNDQAHLSLAKQLKEHTITRRYHAVVYDNIKDDEGVVDQPIGRDPHNRFKMGIVYEGGRHAVTHFRVLERFGKFTWIEARLETGRTHQIRVHMAFLKHPLLGDQVYGPKKILYGASTQVLHAKILGFKHPRSGALMEFSADLPPEFQRTLDLLRN